MPFDQQFIWGASTSSYQIEGAADADGKGRSIWDVFCEKPGAIKEGQTGAVACDHYNRFEEDVALMQQIGLQGYRFSLAWPRIIPNGHDGVLNEKGLDFYDRLIDTLLAAKIEPFITLYHWDMPQEVFARGGWLNPDCAVWFEHYAQAVADRFADRVKNWITFNEPQCAISLGHEVGKHAPGIRLSFAQVLQAGHHLLLAHGRAAAALRAVRPDARIGFAPVGTLCYPPDESAENIAAARKATFDDVNRGCWAPAWFSDPVFFGRYPEEHLEKFGRDAPVFTDEEMKLICQPLDLCAVNFYEGHPVAADGNGWKALSHPPGYARSAFGWPITPSAIYWLCTFYYERYQKPIVITENGISCTDWVDDQGRVDDPNRINYLQRHLRQLRRAADDGIPVRGYYHWSLMDNFEWAEGYQQRFGLIHVDYQTQKRTLKQSAHWYRDVIKTNGERL